MSRDPYSAVWVSHSSLGDFLKCPWAYYLHNVYKNPKTGKKINLVSPALSLGSAVHEVVEGLADYPADKRFDRVEELLQRFDEAWKKFSGKKGGFRTPEEEAEAKARGKAMIKRVIAHPGPLQEKIVRLPEGKGGMLPHFYLADDIILCGKIDWLQYVPEDNSLRVLDFKTGKNEEKGDSLQLPIYQLLLHNLQKRKVSGAAYWYLDSDDSPKEVALPSLDESFEKVGTAAKKVAEAREKWAATRDESVFACPQGPEGCFACRPFEKIIRGEAEFLGNGEYGQEMYMV
ncbi:MAG: PD-(D/E)XK nuclease family protein [Candidatus Pacebacteria bacterium]|nr:PD-(D/E)XK nuclease family protein [Candidatus Paceibacterota bacterium]